MIARGILATGLTATLILTGAIRAAPAHAGGGTNLGLKADSTASDADVSAVVEARADQGTVCSGQVHKGRFRRFLPSQQFHTSGAVYWEWRINGHVSAGDWIVVLSCHASWWHSVRAAHFPATAGVGPGHASELFVPGSLRLGTVKGDASSSGSGGGARSLYPRGQCTWWVSLLRPDLPWFPGAEGNASNWATAAARRNLPTGIIPKAGAVAVFAPGQYQAGTYGHVAYVLSVNAANEAITVSEFNFYSNRADTRTLPSLGLRFIYRTSVTAPVEGGGPLSPPPSSTPWPTPTIGPSGGSTQAGGIAETSGGVIHTWTDYMNADGAQGSSIPSNATVEISCKVVGFEVADGNTWWYRIASPPWENTYYASADGFYNDGATSGSLLGTPFVDPSVPSC